MLNLCATKKAVAFLNVLRFGSVQMDFRNWFQRRVSVVVSEFGCDLGAKRSPVVDPLVAYWCGTAMGTNQWDMYFGVLECVILNTRTAVKNVILCLIFRHLGSKACPQYVSRRGIARCYACDDFEFSVVQPTYVSVTGCSLYSRTVVEVRKNHGVEH